MQFGALTVGSTLGNIDTIYSGQSHQGSGGRSLIWPLFAEICVCVCKFPFFSQISAVNTNKTFNQ